MLGFSPEDNLRHGRPSRLDVVLGSLRLGLGTWLRAVRAGAPAPLGLEQRLAMLATADAPLERPVQIHWHDRQIPFVVAETDADLAVSLGIVHAHLRLAQIEMMRRVATGRLAEVIGPAGVGLDQALRTIDFVAAGRAAASVLSDEAKAWTESFRAGLNHQIARSRTPHEFEVLGIRAEPWSADELMAVSRLASTDFTWKIWMQLMKLRGRSDWDAIWSRLLGAGVLPEPSLAGGGGPLVEAMEAFGRGGSNAYAVAGQRTASGQPLLAGDPHLSIQLPNLWLIAGMHSPSYHAVGLMVPAVPVLGLGRNRDIAWGGTNLHAASSELVALGNDAEPGIERRTERIAVRGGPAREIEVTRSAYGPVVSEVPLLGMGGAGRIALHWIGHRPSDEVTPLLRAARARDWQSFLGGLDGYAIPALNMIYADRHGHIGQCMAATLPRRPAEAPDDLVSPTEALEHWKNMAGARDLPHILDPEQGYVASANNAPPPMEISISRFFSPDDRVGRLREVLGAGEQLAADDLARLQRDVASGPALALRDRLVPLLVTSQGEDNPLAAALRDWDGVYDEASRGALAFELVLYHLVHRLHGGDARELYQASWDPWALIRHDLDTIPPDDLAPLVGAAAGASARAFRRYRVWGAAHRLRLAHAFARLPGLSRRYTFEERAVGGSNETLMKTRHGFSAKRHRVTFGAQARHVSDLADLDENRFALLGGQDGWLGSSTYVDQAELWRAGHHVRVPLRLETVRAEFPHLTTIAPRADGSGP